MSSTGQTKLHDHEFRSVRHTPTKKTANPSDLQLWAANPDPQAGPPHSGNTNVDGEDDETDNPKFELTKYLEESINTYRRKTSTSKASQKYASLSEKEVRKFLKNAEINFTFSSRKRCQAPKAKRLKSQNKSVFTNRTRSDITYTFSKSAEDCVIAQLTVKKGFSIGVQAGASAGVPGGQVNAGMGAGFSREKEMCTGSTLTTRREMQAAVQVPMQSSVTATESVYDVDYDAECEFDIAVKRSQEITYVWGDEKDHKKKDIFGKLKEKLPVAALATDYDFDDSESSHGHEEDDDHVHLRPFFLSKMTEVQHELEVNTDPEPIDPTE